VTEDATPYDTLSDAVRHFRSLSADWRIDGHVEDETCAVVARKRLLETFNLDIQN
jgi:hypothetical protein